MMERFPRISGSILVTGDFNVYVDAADDPDARKLHDMLESDDLRQVVNRNTHKDGRTLDLIIVRGDDDIVNQVDLHYSLPSDHFAHLSVRHRKQIVRNRVLTGFDKISCNVQNFFFRGIARKSCNHTILFL